MGLLKHFGVFKDSLVEVSASNGKVFKKNNTDK